MYTNTYHHFIKEANSCEYIWINETCIPFNELIVSWNIKPSDNQDYTIDVQIKIEGTWYPWMTYANWSPSKRSAYNTKSGPISINQDQIKILDNKIAIGFKVKISSNNLFDKVRSLHACVSQPKLINFILTKPQKTVALSVPHLSQLSLPHAKCMSMCSPTSLTSVLKYLLKDDSINPLYTAEQVKDHAFNIYGNWIFNTAHANTLLNDIIHSWVERVSTFDRVHDLLLKGFPLVISIKPFKEAVDGHLIGLIGYDSKTQEVLCMDPAKNEYPSKYSLEKLSEHWGYRNYIAYIFSPIK